MRALYERPEERAARVGAIEDPALRNHAFHLRTRATATWAGGETISIV